MAFDRKDDPPKIMVRFSDDGGHNWSNEYQMDIGALGNFETRAQLYRLGRARNRVFEFSMSDSVKFWVNGIIVEVQGG